MTECSSVGTERSHNCPAVSGVTFHPIFPIDSRPQLAEVTA